MQDRAAATTERLRIGDQLAVRAMSYRNRIVYGELPAPSTMDFVIGRLDFIKPATIETITIDPASTVHALGIGGTGSYFAGGFLART